MTPSAGSWNSPRPSRGPGVSVRSWSRWTPLALLTKRTSDFGNDRPNGMVDGIRKAWLNARISEVAYNSGRDDAYNATTAHLAANPVTRIWVAIANQAGLGMYQALRDSTDNGAEFQRRSWRW